MTFLSPIHVSTETKSSAASGADLIDQIGKEDIKVHFIENSNDPQLIEQIATATGAEPGGELYPEALSAADRATPTAIKLMQGNAGQFVGPISKSGQSDLSRLKAAGAFRPLFLP